jgi:hypothetical protein
MNITQLKIGLLQLHDSKWKKLLDVFRDRYIPISFIKDENNYFSEAIEFEGKYFYRVDGVTVEALDYEYERVIANPRLYYFSSALKLHHRIRKAKELGIGYDWPTNPAAPIDIFSLANNLEAQIRRNA